MKYSERSGTQNQTGALGERLAARYLTERGLTVVEMNVTRSYGEIDIVARGTSGRLHFVEVKTLSYDSRELLEAAVQARHYNPEDHVDERKIKQLKRVAQAWLSPNTEQVEWQIDVLAIRIVPREKYASVNYLENVTGS